MDKLLKDHIAEERRVGENEYEFIYESGKKMRMLTYGKMWKYFYKPSLWFLDKIIIPIFFIPIGLFLEWYLHTVMKKYEVKKKKKSPYPY